MTTGETPEPAPLLLYAIKQLELLSRSRLDEVLRPAGITTLQYTALTVLARTPRLSSADLARRSFVRAQSTADLVSALDRRGLIARSPDPDNRRRLLITLTPVGYALLEEVDPRVARLEEEMLQGLDAGERRLLRDLLLRARRALSERGEEVAAATP